ncbi:MAG: mechanosensitive ion channel [Candidatus Cloacimonetes bacterium]|nr:mechanosensitive ion channel [Candidatus Cloacimonadota bacterium]
MLANLIQFLKESWSFFRLNFSDYNYFFQIFLIFSLLLITSLLSRYLLKKSVKSSIWENDFLITFDFLKVTLLPFLLCLALLIIWGIFQTTDYPANVIRIALSLSTFWILINIVTYFIRNSILKKFLYFLSMVAAVLGSTGLLHKTIIFLDSLAIKISHTKISFYTVLKAILILLIFSWFAQRLSLFFERKLIKSNSIKPSLGVLFSKIIKGLLFTTVFLLVTSSLGINLATFALFTGAIGIGIGLGLQKIVSNLICGIILLLDDSVKPGDVIEVEDSYGYVRKMGARYISVLAIDGREFLIPNETLITNQVVNWSHSDDLIKIIVTLGCSYKSDVPKVMEILKRVPEKFNRVLTDPEPKSYFTGFGESSLDFELHVWVNDLKNGIIGIRSDLLVEIWSRLKEAGIEIPYPQRDLHFKTVPSGWNEIDKKT